MILLKNLLQNPADHGDDCTERIRFTSDFPFLDYTKQVGAVDCQSGKIGILWNIFFILTMHQLHLVNAAHRL